MPMKFHKPETGDDWGTLAKRFNVSAEQLATLNKFDMRGFILVPHYPNGRAANTVRGAHDPASTSRGLDALGEQYLAIMTKGLPARPQRHARGTGPGVPASRPAQKGPVPMRSLDSRRPDQVQEDAEGMEGLKDLPDIAPDAPEYGPQRFDFNPFRGLDEHFRRRR